MKKNNLTKGILLALLTSVISGVSIFYAKVAVIKVDPLVLTASRNMYVGLLFIIVLLVTRKYREFKLLSIKNRILVFLVGLIGGSIPFYFFFTGLKLIGAQQANILHKTLFLWVALWSAVFLKERLNLALITSGLLIFIGTFIFAPVRIGMEPGVFLVLGATLLWSIETILAKKLLTHISSELVGASRMVLGGIVLASLTLVTGKGAAILALTLPQVSVIALGGTLLFFYVFTWFKALSYAPANLVTLILTGSVVFGSLLNGTILGVELKLSDLYSIGLIALGVFVSSVINVNIRKKALPNTIHVTNE